MKRLSKTVRRNDGIDRVCPVVEGFAKGFDVPKEFVSRRSILPDKVTYRRAWLAIDWDIRSRTPALLRLAPEMSVHADALEALPRITTPESLDKSRETIRAALKVAPSTDEWDEWATECPHGGAARLAARDLASMVSCRTAGGAARLATWKFFWERIRRWNDWRLPMRFHRPPTAKEDDEIDLFGVSTNRIWNIVFEVAYIGLVRGALPLMRGDHGASERFHSVTNDVWNSADRMVARMVEITNEEDFPLEEHLALIRQE